MNLVGCNTGKSYPIEANRWIGEGNELLNLEISPKLNPKQFFSKPFSLWRYRDALPLPQNEIPVSLGEPITPLIKIQFKSGFSAQIKQDQLFTTGSYKDRGAAVLISFLKNLNANEVIQDSSGNAGAAIAAYAARAGIACNIYLPQNTPEAKVLQMKAYGAKIVKIEGDRQATADATLLAAEGKAYASHCYHPVFYHGTKTFAYEIAEQNNWEAPDSLVLPAGNGTLLIGCYIGFSELYQLGIIHKMPKLVAVQADACNPVYREFWGDKSTFQYSQTAAEGIAIPQPIRKKQILEAVINTGGNLISVTESEIEQTWKEMAHMGFFIEPTSAATIAGLKKYGESLENTEGICSLFSGNGLKSLGKISQFVEK